MHGIWLLPHLVEPFFLPFLVFSKQHMTALLLSAVPSQSFSADVSKVYPQGALCNSNT